MTSIDYWGHIDAIKRKDFAPQAAPRTPAALANKYGGYVLASRKKKGAGKGYKNEYRWEWRDRKGYMAELRELFPREYAFQLLRDERAMLLGDLWWDVDGYRAEHIKDYRARIKAIRQAHGLSQSDVAEFMRVG